MATQHRSVCVGCGGRFPASAFVLIQGSRSTNRCRDCQVIRRTRSAYDDRYKQRRRSEERKWANKAGPVQRFVEK
jgi:ribosomal protein L36